MDHGVQFVLTYESIVKFDARFKAVEEGVAKLVARDDEIAALRAENAELKAQIAAAVDSSDAIEAGKATNLDGIRNRAQVNELESILRAAKYEAIRKESDKGGHFEDNKDRIGDVLGSASAENILKAIDTRTKGKTDLGEPVSGMSNEGFEAQYDFRRMVQDWIVRNPNATPDETEEAISKMLSFLRDTAGSPGLCEVPLQNPRPKPWTRTS